MPDVIDPEVVHDDRIPIGFPHSWDSSIGDSIVHVSIILSNVSTFRILLLYRDEE